MRAFPFPSHDSISKASHFVSIGVVGVGRITMHYCTYGNPANPAVLCSHALTGTALDFHYLAEKLSEDFYVIAADMPGRGLSSHLSDKTRYTNQHHIQWTLALLEHLGITKVHWIGSSMGGIMGMMLCHSNPEMIQSLMLNDVGSVLAKEGLVDIVRYTGNPLPKKDNAAFAQRFREDYAAFGLTEEKHWEHLFFSRVKEDAEGYYEMRRDPAVIEPLRAWVQQTPEPVDISLEIFWQAVRCPVMIFHGEHSLLLRHDTAEAMAHSHNPDVVLHHMQGIGHLPMLMDDYQIQIVHDWLKRVA